MSDAKQEGGVKQEKSSNSTATAPTSSVIMNPINVATNVQTSFRIPQAVQAHSPALAQIKVKPRPVDGTGLVQIPCPDLPPGSIDNAYVVGVIVIENKFIHCINMTAGKNDEQLVLLQELVESLLPNVSMAIYPTAAELLRRHDFSTHLPNWYQRRTFNHFGFEFKNSWQAPLIPAKQAEAAVALLRKIIWQPFQIPAPSPVQMPPPVHIIIPPPLPIQRSSNV